MANFKIPFDVQRAIADALGLEVRQITRIVIDVSPNSAPRVRVSMIPNVEQCDALTRVFEATSLSEVAEPAA